MGGKSERQSRTAEGGDDGHSGTDRHDVALAGALASLESPGEAMAFLRDLCTPAEIRAMAERWHVAQLLDEGVLSYRDINAETGVSTTTVARVARFLNDEPNRGYRLVLERMKNAGSRKRSP